MSQTPLVPPDIQVREAPNPALTLKERWLRRVKEAVNRGGFEAALPMLSQIFDESSTDDLTSLFNPRAFYKILNQIVLPRMRRHPSGVHGAVVFIDIDRFKKVNTMFGHAGGNEILRVFAQILRAKFRTYDIIGRLGGDEFVIIADGLPESAVQRRIEQVRVEFAEFPWALKRIDGGDSSVRHAFTFTFKVTAITSPDVLDDLIRQADESVMQQKNDRINNEERRGS